MLKALLSIVSANNVASAIAKFGSKTLFSDLTLDFILQTNYRHFHSCNSESLILIPNIKLVIGLPKFGPLNYVSFFQLMPPSCSVLHKLEICGHLWFISGSHISYPLGLVNTSVYRYKVHVISYGTKNLYGCDVDVLALIFPSKNGKYSTAIPFHLSPCQIQLEYTLFSFLTNLPACESHGTKISIYPTHIYSVYTMKLYFRSCGKLSVFS